MAGDRKLLQQAKSEIAEIDPARARELLATDKPPVLIDVREPHEWETGRIKGALHIPQGELLSRIGAAVPDRARPIVAYCARGNRSALAAGRLKRLGYREVASLAGGIEAWRQNGLPLDLPEGLDEAQSARYSRHLLIPEVGVAG